MIISSLKENLMPEVVTVKKKVEEVLKNQVSKQEVLAQMNMFIGYAIVFSNTGYSYLTLSHHKLKKLD